MGWTYDEALAAPRWFAERALLYLSVEADWRAAKHEEAIARLKS